MKNVVFCDVTPCGPWTYVSEKHITSIVMVTRIGELGPTLAVNNNRSTLRLTMFLAIWLFVTLIMEAIRFLRNVGSHKSHTASYRRRRHSSDAYLSNLYEILLGPWKSRRKVRTRTGANAWLMSRTARTVVWGVNTRQHSPVEWWILFRGAFTKQIRSLCFSPWR
jgi:hypothetical protein